MAFFISSRPRRLIQNPIGLDVYVKASWNDPWIWLEFATANRMEETIAPVVASCNIILDFGNISRAELLSFRTYFSTFLQGVYVKVVAYDYFGFSNLFIGKIDKQSDKLDSAFKGVQTWLAYDLNQTMDRTAVNGSHTIDGFIDRAIKFNGYDIFGSKLTGNRDPGTNLLGGTGIWSNLDILKHLLATHFNFPFPIVLYGYTRALNNIKEEYSIEGKTPFEIINDLIVRSRGLGWRITNSGFDVGIEVFSLVTEGVQLSDQALHGQAGFTINFGTARNVHPTVHVDALAKYGSLVVRGGPIRSCFTASFIDNTLEEGWDNSDALIYRQGSGIPSPDADDHDAERSRKKLNDVYQRFKIPDNWNGFSGDGAGGTQTNAVPDVNTFTGDILPLLQSPMHWNGTVFERSLPFEETDGEGEQYQKMMAFIKIDDKQYFMDELDKIELTPASITPSDTDMSVRITPRLNHISALNTFDTADEDTEDSNIEPEYDYNDIGVTVNVRLDKHLLILGTIAGVAQTESVQTKLIPVPEFETWYVAANTVIDIVDGEFVYSGAGFTLLRDDKAKLFDTANLAASYYGNAKGTLDYTADTCVDGFRCGTMITGCYNDNVYAALGTIIVRRVWTANQGVWSTQVTTSFSDLNPAELLEGSDA